MTAMGPPGSAKYSLCFTSTVPLASAASSQKLGLPMHDVELQLAPLIKPLSLRGG